MRFHLILGFCSLELGSIVQVWALRRLRHDIYFILNKKLRNLSHQLNSKNNGPVLLRLYLGIY